MKCLLVSNCQRIGLSWSLNFLAPHLDLDVMTLPEFQEAFNNKSINLQDYDIIIGFPQFFSHLKDNVDISVCKCLRLPSIFFDAFHPDICLINSGDTRLKGRMGIYHSSIIFSAFYCGYPADKIQGLFNEAVYKQATYFDCWDTSVQNFEKHFSFLNFDVKAYISKWSRHGSFMTLFNHPRIHCTYDIARKILEYLDIEYFDCPELMIYDNHMEGPVWPVYPEIAAVYGFEGSYRFKSRGSFKSFGLKELIEKNIEIYNKVGRDNMEVMGRSKPKVEKLINLFRNQS